MKDTMTGEEIVWELDYSGGINYNKMLPPEDERWKERWHPASKSILKSDVLDWINAHTTDLSKSDMTKLKRSLVLEEK